MADKINWEEIDPLLGLVTDKEICAKFSVDKETVQKRRAALNIPAYNKKESKKWINIDPLLGTMPDAAISKKYGLMSNTAVKNRRKMFDIPVFRKHDWPQIDKLIGKIPDKEITKKFGIPEHTLYARRKELGIPNRRDKKDIPWPEIDPILGTMPDSTIAEIFLIGGGGQVIQRRREKFGIAAFDRGVTKINWTEIDPILGTAFDREIADRFGISRTSVLFRRQVLGISAFNIAYSRKAVKIDWEKIEPLLGSMIDPELAEKYGISASSVHKRRVRLGIRAYHQPIDWSRHEKSLKDYDTETQKIAIEAGVTKPAVYRVRIKQNIKWKDKVNNNKIRKLDWEKIKKDFATMTDKEISEKYGTSLTTVWRNRQKYAD